MAVHDTQGHTHTHTLHRPTWAHGPPIGAAVAAAAITLLAMAAAALWQATREEESAAPTAAVSLPAAPAPVPTYYLVGSQVLADALRTAVGEADTLRARRGEAVVESSVLLVASAEDEVVLQRLAEQDAIRAELGLPPIHFVDLRVLPATAEPPGTAGLAEQDGSVPAPALTAATTPADTDERSQPAGETWDTP